MTAPVAPPVHVLLDLDGTLVDSEPGIVATLRWAFEAEGLRPPTPVEARVVIGPPFEHGLPLLGVQPEQLWPLINRYRNRYERSGLFEASVFPRVVDMLDELRDEGHVLSLATAKPEHSAARVVERFGLAPYLTVVAGATLTPERRTKDRVIANALERLGVVLGPGSDVRVVMVGDREHDVSGAAVHGIPTIGAAWGYGTAQELADAGVWRVAASPAEVPGLVARHVHCDEP